MGESARQAGVARIFILTILAVNMMRLPLYEPVRGSYGFASHYVRALRTSEKLKLTLLTCQLIRAT
jgi:hypothetical protein